MLQCKGGFKYQRTSEDQKHMLKSKVGLDADMSTPKDGKFFAQLTQVLTRKNSYIVITTSRIVNQAGDNLLLEKIVCPS